VIDTTVVAVCNAWEATWIG